MRSLFFAALGTVCTIAAPTLAQERQAIGNGRLFSNDFFGDQQDRWRTGSYVYSHIRGRVPFSGVGQPFGDIIEYRIRGEIIAPETGAAGADQRPYVGAFSIGARTHFGFGSTQVSVGSDITAVGPQTGLGDFQDAFHDLFSFPTPSRENELENAFFLSGSAAVSHSFSVGDSISIRPFAEAHVGVEDLVRAGADVMIGNIGQSDLMIRDVVTGQLYRGTQSPGAGFSYVIGADFAAVESSEFLPADDGYIASETRTRARAGVHYQFSEQSTMFYGVTYLSEEFEGQPEGQFVGSLRLNFNF